MFRLQSIISYRLLSRESIFAALLGMSAGVLSIEFWLQFQMGSSLCQTSACQAVAEFVRIGEPALVLFGSGFFWLLFVLALIGMVTSAKWIWTLIGVALFGALAFDGALIGYQFVGLGQKCYLCLAVGIALGLFLLLHSLVQRSWVVPLIGLAVFASGFTANSILKIQPDAPRLAETAFVTIPAKTENPSLKMHLFFSFHCSHCFKVLADLSVNEPWQAEWSLSTYDQAPQDLYRMAEVRSRIEGADNPFKVVVDVEKMEEVDSVPVDDSLRETVKMAEAYFHNAGFKGVPTLVAKEGPGRRVISVGRGNIMRYLVSRGLVTRVLRFEDELEQQTSKSVMEKSS